MKVVSWNIEGRLSRFAEEGKRGSPEHIVGEIERLDGDVVFLAEAFDSERPIEAPIEERLKHLGYHAMIKTAYAETREREYAATLEPHTMFLSRLDIKSSGILRPADIRSMPSVTVIDPESRQPIQYLGVHLDDRKEENRIAQIEDIISYINSSPLPTIVIGDYNAMHRSSVQARILQFPGTSQLFNLLPFDAPRHKLQRLVGMATGTTLDLLESKTNLRDVDTRRRLTETAKTRDQEWLPSIPIVQIDHIYTSPSIETSDFHVSRDGGSDHRAISATIAITKI